MTGNKKLRDNKISTIIIFQNVICILLHLNITMASTDIDDDILSNGYIHPLRSQAFSFQLKKSLKPRSELTDVARKHLFEDSLYLQVEEQKRRVQELKAGLKVDNRGVGNFDYKLLAAHYCIGKTTEKFSPLEAPERLEW
jgi:hypothetical protein